MAKRPSIKNSSTICKSCKGAGDKKTADTKGGCTGHCICYSCNGLGSIVVRDQSDVSSGVVK